VRDFLQNLYNLVRFLVFINHDAKGVASSGTLDEIESERDKENLKKVEAVLFISGRFLNLKELVSLADLNPLILKEVLAKLKEDYEKRDSAVQIIEKNGMWKMDVSQDYSGIVNQIATGDSEFSKAEQETLAIIAFKQPIKQSVLIKIRGNKAYDHIKKFADNGLIIKKKSGHTYDLSLNDDFYDYFNISQDDSAIPQDREEENGN